jgi:hypothetical protein
MRRCNHAGDSIPHQRPADRQRIVQRRRPIIHAGQDVAVNIDALLDGELRETRPL